MLDNMIGVTNRHITLEVPNTVGSTRVAGFFLDVEGEQLGKVAPPRQRPLTVA